MVCLSTFIESIVESFRDNLVVEDRYQMILDGLQVTLFITFFAVVIGTLLGGLVCRLALRSPWSAQDYYDGACIRRQSPVFNPHQHLSPEEELRHARCVA